MPEYMKFTDLFSRANNADLGTAYDAGYTGNTTAKIVDETVSSVTLGTVSLESLNSPTLTDDQWASMTIRSFTGAATINLGVTLRMPAPATHSYYAFIAEFGSGVHTAHIFKYVGGAFTSIVQVVTDQWIPGDIVKGTVVGTRLTLYRNNIELCADDDTSLTGGRPGIIALVTAGGSLANATLDNFTVGDFTKPVTVYDTYYHQQRRRSHDAIANKKRVRFSN